MEFSKMTNNFSHMMKKSTILRGLLALLIWIPVLMVVWFWSTFILAFLMRGGAGGSQGEEVSMR